MTARRALGACAFAGLLIAGCGGPDMTGSAATDLQSRVAAVRTAVTSGDRNAAEEALNTLHLAVMNLLDRGELTEDKAADIVAAANDVANRLSMMPTTTTTTAPPIIIDKKGHEKDEKHGHGGHGKD